MELQRKIRGKRVIIVTAVYRFFRSVKLAIILLILIAVLSALSTLIPQGREPQHYLQNYAPLLAKMLLFLHFESFFRSLLFLLPAGVVFINLAVCTADRLVRRAKKGTSRRYGPDLIHIGILLLMIGGMISLLGRQQGYVWLTKGDWAELPGGYRLVLKSFTYTAYEDGRPKDYVSSVDIKKDDKLLESCDIRVNRPLKVGSLRVFQDSYSILARVVLEDKNGKYYSISTGEGFWIGNKGYVLIGIEPKPGWREKERPGTEAAAQGMCAVFQEFEGETPTKRVILSTSDTIDQYTVCEILSTERTGLRIARDTGLVPVFVSFGIILAGLALTFAQKFWKGNQ